MLNKTSRHTAVADVPADNPAGTMDRFMKGLRVVLAVPKRRLHQRAAKSDVRLDRMMAATVVHSLRPFLTVVWSCLLLAVVGLAFLAFVMFWGYGWHYTREWFSR